MRRRRIKGHDYVHNTGVRVGRRIIRGDGLSANLQPDRRHRSGEILGQGIGGDCCRIANRHAPDHGLVNLDLDSHLRGISEIDQSGRTRPLSGAHVDIQNLATLGSPHIGMVQILLCNQKLGAGRIQIGLRDGEVGLGNA